MWLSLHESDAVKRLKEGMVITIEPGTPFLLEIGFWQLMLPHKAFMSLPQLTSLDTSTIWAFVLRQAAPR